MRKSSPYRKVGIILVFSFLLISATFFLTFGSNHCKAIIDDVWIKDHGDNTRKSDWKDKVWVEEGDYVTIHVKLQVDSIWDSTYSTEDRKYCEFGLEIKELDTWPNPDQIVVPYAETKVTGRICGRDVSNCHDSIDNHPVYEFKWKIEDVPRYEKRKGDWVEVGTQWDSPIADNRLELKISPMSPGNAATAWRMGLGKEQLKRLSNL